MSTRPVTVDVPTTTFVHSRIAYDLNGAAEAVSLSRRTIQAAIASGELVPNYSGAKPLLRAVVLDEWVASLPTKDEQR